MRRLFLSALLMSSLFVGTTATTFVRVADATPLCGEVLIKGSQWLQGVGVDVRSNGPNTFTGESCKGVSVSTPTDQYGYGFQCVELAARLYRVRNWGTVFADGGPKAGNLRFGAKYLPEGSSGLIFYPVTSSYSPVPGDLIIESGAGFGHVSVIDHLEPGANGTTTVVAAEENASLTGWHVYSRTATSMTGGYHPVRGFLHSPRNTLVGATAPRRGFVAVGLGTGNGLVSVVSSGRRNLNITLAPKSSPDVVATSKGSFAVAAVDTSNHLIYIDGQGRRTDTAILVTPETNPSLRLDANDIPWIAAHGANHQLVVWSPTRVVTTSVTLRSKSSPRLALDAAGRFNVAVVSPSDAVVVVADSGTTTPGFTTTGMSVRANSDPSLAVLGSGTIKVVGVTSSGVVQIATSQLGGGYLLETPASLTVRGGTSAVIHAFGAIGFQVAYVTTAGVPQMFGTLGVLPPVTGTLAAVTTPSMSIRADGMVVLAVRDSANQLWVINKAAAMKQPLPLSPFVNPAVALLR